MKRYLGMTEQEISENEVMFAEERGDTDVATPDAAGLRSVGVSPGGIQSDLEGLGPEAGVAAGGPEAGPDAMGPGNQGAAGAVGATPAI